MGNHTTIDHRRTMATNKIVNTKFLKTCTDKQKCRERA